jgi:hypothetical protein
MIIARGFVEANDCDCVANVVAALRERGFEVSDVRGAKIVYRIGREKFAEARPEIDALLKIDGVRSVYLAYYSLEKSSKRGSFDADQFKK